MMSRYFGQFLLERGLVTKEGLLEALEYQSSANYPIEIVAVIKNFLTVDQVRELREEQVRAAKSFSDVALDRGALSPEQVDEIWRFQNERWVFLGDALVRRGHLGKEALYDALGEYQKAYHGQETDLEARLDAVPHREVVQTLLDLTVRNLLNVCSDMVKISPAGRIETLDDADGVVFSQRVAGDPTFVYGLCMGPELAAAVARGLGGIEATGLNDEVQDALAEFVNIVVGNACAALSTGGRVLKPEPPLVALHNGQDVFAGGRHRLILRMTSEQGEFLVGIAFS